MTTGYISGLLIHAVAKCSMATDSSPVVIVEYRLYMQLHCEPSSSSTVTVPSLKYRRSGYFRQ